MIEQNNIIQIKIKTLYLNLKNNMHNTDTFILKDIIKELNFFLTAFNNIYDGDYINNLNFIINTGNELLNELKKLRFINNGELETYYKEFKDIFENELIPLSNNIINKNNTCIN